MRYHPVVVMPPGAVVLDLSGEAPEPVDWSIGRYDEVRGIYTQELFAGGRCVHMGIDLGAPAGTPVHAFDAGEVVAVADNQAPGDYGPTLLTAHQVDGEVLYVLLGHLSPPSLRHSPAGRRFGRGEVLGWIGSTGDNGGWPPHVHVQLARQRPPTADLPGAVTLAQREDARTRYPDPRQILGRIYE